MDLIRLILIILDNHEFNIGNKKLEVITSMTIIKRK